jgi:hypothetical protein
MSNFVFDNINLFNEYFMIDEKLKYNVKKSKFLLNKDSLYLLKNSKKESYRNIYKNYLEKKNIFTKEDEYLNDFGIFKYCFVDSNGIIVYKNNKFLINGGCLWKNSEIRFSTAINIIKYSNVISIACKWGAEIWHFPYEAFVALKMVPNDILKICKIHVTKKTKYVIEWLNFMNINESQIIEGNILAENLYIPRMGKCGNPYYSQLLWINDIIYKHLNNNNKLEYVILVKRNKTRILKNHNELKIELQTFCDKHSLKLIIHDDQKLPSLKDQHKLFNKAKYVFAPHGAAGINISAMKKESWYIELLDDNDINICYSRLCYLLDINYYGLSMNNYIMDLEKLKDIYKTII